MELIEPYENESYNDYLNRLLAVRPMGWKSKPKDIYTEGHHILPRCLGGGNQFFNIIILLPQEHYYCHKLLALENNKISQLQNAWWFMCHKIDGDVKHYYHVSAEEYAEARKRMIILTKQMNSIPVVEFITGAIYPSAEEAAKQLNIKSPSNITACCKKQSNTASGYRFCYLSDYLIGNYEDLPKGRSKRIIDLDTKKVYESGVKAAEEIGVLPSHVREVCKGQRKSARGHRYAFYDDYLSGNYELKKIGHEGRIVQEVDTGVVYRSAAEAAKELNLDSSAILKVCNGKLKTTKGHKFVFYSEQEDN